MIPYLVVFILNLFLSYFANKCYNNNKKLSSIICIVVLVLTNTIFSGYRDFGIGVDTNVYIEPYFQRALSLNSFKDFFSGDDDKGFLILAYISTLISNEPQSFLVIIALFIQIFFYLSLWQYKKIENISIFVATTLFCIVFYCHTLNLMRQFCAISLLSFAFSLYIQEKFGPYVVLQVLAYFFHSTSVFFILVPIIWKISNMKNIKMRNTYLGCLIIILIIIIPLYYYIITLLGNYSIISEVLVDRYGVNSEYLLSNSSYGTGIGKVFYFIYPIIFVSYAVYKKCSENTVLFFILVLTIITSFVQVLGYKVQFVDRMGFYFSFIMYIFISKIFVSGKISTLIKTIIFAIYIINWISMYPIGGGGDVYPYTSKILNITK